MNKSLQDSCIPQILKDGIVTPIFKEGDKYVPKNYRPISLTCHIMKIMERVICKSISEYVEHDSLISNHQHGFRSKRSTVSELLTHHSNIVNALDDGKGFDVLMLDYSKAFDTVSHTLLLNKLKHIGINGLLGKWICHFLLGRRQRVKVGSALSDWVNVLSGVPQGSILGPLLFILFINDIYATVSESNISSYADDTKMSRCISTPADCNSLQSDLNKVVDWSTRNLMKFNESKLELLRFQGTERSYEYVLPNGRAITEVNSSKDLGIYFDNDGTFSSHIKQKVGKANQICGYILRTFVTRNSRILMRMFKSLVLPIIEYGCVIWNPSDQKTILEIESVQRHFTAKLNGMHELDYWDRLNSLKLYSLERRRDRYVIIYIFKILYGIVPNPGISWTFHVRRGRLLEHATLKNNSRHGSKLKQHSFLYCASKIFNCLPADLRNFDGSILTLKTKLDDFIRGVPDQPRLPGYTRYSLSQSNNIASQYLSL